jgi:hypothetical protein
VIFAPLARTGVRPPEIYDSCDIDSGADAVVRLQDGVARRGLKAKVANRIRAIDRRQRTGERVIRDEAAASCAHIREAARVECVAGLAVVRERIAQHQRSVIREAVIEFAGGFRLRSRNGKEIGCARAGGKARKRSPGEK